ncbi:Monothiol glutaredoxin-4 [Mycena venus]|uniref:Monothiol glutaredoxin-4 n=1 Tax=Mycena venus TaxID=2733690 RepID=A0A8H6X7F5_9AGAR|nr:Monothiol glutaredoxin-4 [Mycena venus]
MASASNLVTVTDASHFQSLLSADLTRIVLNRGGALVRCAEGPHTPRSHRRFMMGSPEEPRCGFRRKISALLEEQGVQFSSFDILQDENVRQGLKKLNDWPAFPQRIININGELVGGLDIAQEMVQTGEFYAVVKS